MKLTRRHFLLLGASAALAAGLGALSFGALRRRLIEAKLVAAFPYLDLDPEGVTTFVWLHEEHLYPIRRNPLKLLGPLPEAVRLRYLASTDFFPNGADEARLVRFTALYEPYASPCFHPFARRES